MMRHELTTKWLAACATVLGIAMGTLAPAHAQVEKGILDLQVAVGVPVLFGDVAGGEGNDPFDAGTPRIFGGYALGVCITPAIEVGAFVDVGSWKHGTLTTPPDESKMEAEYVIGTLGCFGRYFFSPHAKLQPYGEFTIGGSWLSLTADNAAANPPGRLDYGFGAGVMYVFSRHLTLSADLLYRHGSVDDAEVVGGDEDDLDTRTVGVPRVIPRVALHVMLF